ncbi:hypothetical protein JCM3774_004813 [Rhodotorula dairenensis]
MGFFSRLRKPDAATKAAQDERAKREAKQGARNRRQSRDELRHWEDKYGRDVADVADAGARTGSLSSDEPTVVAIEAAPMEKDRSRGSMSTFKSYKLDLAPARASIDFIPRIELTYGEPLSLGSPKVVSIVPPSSSEGSPYLSRAATSFDDGNRRPALAVIQSSSEQAARSAPTSKRDSHLAERQVQVASPQPRRQSRATSMYSLGVPAASSKGGLAASPRLQDLMNDLDNNDDDDLPLAAMRSRSSPSIPQSGSMYALSPPSPALGANAASSSVPSLALPTSRSRASLSIPPVLLPPSPTLEALAGPRSLPREETQRSLASIGRTGTLIDLTAPSTFDPYYGRNRRSPNTAGAERIAVGERRKASPPNGVSLNNTKKDSGGGAAKIMEFGELEERHKKRMSTLQGTANEKVEAEKALAMYQEKQRKEAEAQRRREARRSVDSGLYLLGAGAGKAADASTKRSSRMSVSNLSLLLKRGSSSTAAEAKSVTPPPVSTADSRAIVEDDDVPLDKLSRSPTGAVTSSRPAVRARRSSTQALTTTSQRRPSTVSPANVRPADPHGGGGSRRRHSLGTLLEVSHDQTDIQADLLDLHARGTPSPEVEKVFEWRRRSSVQLSELAPLPTSTVIDSRQQRRQSSLFIGEAVVLQKVAQAAPPPPKKKSHDWLNY